MKFDNLIVIKDGAYTDIKKALNQWINLHSPNLQDGLKFELFKNGPGNHFIQADKRLDNELFFFLINYLYFPEGINYKIVIEGFTIGKDENELKNKDLLVYISPNDTDYDNVFVTTSDNENIMVDFGGKITATNEKKTFAIPEELHFGIPETIVVEKRDNRKTDDESTKNKLEKRFGIMSAIIIAAFALALLIFRTDEHFLIINCSMALAVWGWLFFDYEILQVDKLYFRSVALCLGIFFFGYLLKNEYLYEDDAPLVSMCTTMPIFFLILQRPMRLAFKSIMKREPQVEKPPPSFADMVYSLILWITTILIPVFYYGI